jgi:UDP-N-acetylmuramyl pentapeptide phosphotransferase/UDP-N-acetylglucosamine-1-phosphate transferase
VIAQSAIALVLAALAVAALTAVAVGLARQWLLRHGIHDAPGARSSHARPTARGAGMVLIPLVALAWIAGDLVDGRLGQAAIGAALAAVLAAVSAVDDLRGLSPAPRFAAQVAVVAVGIGLMDGGPVFQGLLPPWLDRVLAGLAWLWFINLFNFMDGIDGQAGAETIVIATGLLVVGAIAGWPAAAWLPALWLIGAAGGFLIWNRPPARIFLGDSGSVGLGVLLGWLLLDAAARGEWAVALILPGYYWADATLTLLRRLLRGAKIWHPHREHAYQRAVQAGWSHGRVTMLVAKTGAALIGLAALAAAGRPWLALLGAAGLVLAALTRLGLARGAVHG